LTSLPCVFCGELVTKTRPGTFVRQVVFEGCDETGFACKGPGDGVIAFHNVCSAPDGGAPLRDSDFERKHLRFYELWEEHKRAGFAPTQEEADKLAVMVGIDAPTLDGPPPKGRRRLPNGAWLRSV